MTFQPLKPCHFKKSFLTSNITSSQANICGRDSLRPPQELIFFLIAPSYFKTWDWRLSAPAEKRVGVGELILCSNRDREFVKTSVKLSVWQHCKLTVQLHNYISFTQSFLKDFFMPILFIFLDHFYVATSRDVLFTLKRFFRFPGDCAFI